MQGINPSSQERHTYDVRVSVHLLLQDSAELQRLSTEL